MRGASVMDTQELLQEKTSTWITCTLQPAWMAIWLESASDPCRGLFLKQLLGVHDTGTSHPSSLGC